MKRSSFSSLPAIAKNRFSQASEGIRNSNIKIGDFLLKKNNAGKDSTPGNTISVDD